MGYPDYNKIGEMTRVALLDYVTKRAAPPDGPRGFLWSVLANDLAAACREADDQNRHAIWDLFCWLYNFAPCGCWGSPEKVVTWLQGEGEIAIAERAIRLLGLTPAGGI